jgi:hypothetical protein
MDGIDFLKVKYFVALQASNLLSVLFQGQGQWDGGTESEYVSALTLDLDTLRILKLTDFVTVDEIFAERIRTSKRIFDSEGNLIGSTIMNGLWPKEEIIKLYNTPAFSKMYYVTKDELVVFFSAPANHYFRVAVVLN